MNPSILQHFVRIVFLLTPGAALAQRATVFERSSPAPAVMPGGEAWTVGVQPTIIPSIDQPRP